MFSTDADGTRMKESASYCYPAAEMLLSRPRSSTPTMHEQIMRERHRVRAPEEVSRPGNVGVGREGPYCQPAGYAAVKRQHDGCCQRSHSSDYQRPLLQAVIFYL